MKCDYCGEFEAFIEIPNPNEASLGETKTWKVCGWCAKVIPLQKEMSMHEIMKHLFNTPQATELADREIARIKQEIREIEQKSGMPTITTTITRRD